MAALLALLLGIAHIASANAQTVGDTAPIVANEAPSRERLDIKTGQCSEPKRQRYKVEVVADDATRRRGLQHRSHLPADTGMLFLWPDSARRVLWMKDTLIPLDMLFLAADGRILAIEASREPHSERLVSPQVAALAVLELPGGTAKRHGICASDQVLSKRFTTEAKPSRPILLPSPF